MVMRKNGRVLASDLAATRAKFDQWRAKRERGAKIPARLWAQAVALAGKYGVSRTVTVLRLDYYSLQRRLAGGNASEASRPLRGGELGSTELAERGSACFVELPPLVTPQAHCSIEMCAIDGACLRIQLHGTAMPDLVGLAHQLWRGK
jgi:hypothetical protein